MTMCRKGLHRVDVPGARGRRNECRECVRAYGRIYKRGDHRRTRAFLDAVRVERGCAVCGFNTHPAALQFDHIVPVGGGGRRGGGVKSMAEARALSVDPNVQVLCANCHAIKTRENGDYKRPVTP